jgi:hypothetical protein
MQARTNLAIDCLQSCPDGVPACSGRPVEHGADCPNDQPTQPNPLLWSAVLTSYGPVPVLCDSRSVVRPLCIPRFLRLSIPWLAEHDQRTRRGVDSPQACYARNENCCGELDSTTDTRAKSSRPQTLLDAPPTKKNPVDPASPGVDANRRGRHSEGASQGVAPSSCCQCWRSTP